jgi:hypothetical protein
MLQWPFDVARLLVEETARGGLPAEDPEIVRFLSGIGWRVETALTPRRDAITRDEARRTFGANERTAAAIAREAHDLALQARLESLLVPRMEDRIFDAIVRVRGVLRGPSLVVFPHIEPLLVLVRALVRQVPDGRELVVFRKRGLPPPRAGRDLVFSPLRDTAINRRLAARRRAEEDAMGVRWEEDPSTLRDHLAAGRVVAAAFDDRGFDEYDVVRFLDRPALLSPEPWSAARGAEVPVVAATIRRERDKRYVVQVRPPQPPDREAYLRTHAEPFLRSNPGHYASWLAECRIRGALHDRPLFTTSDGA